MNKTIFITIIAVVFLFELPLYAYLDPGTGSMLLQILAVGALFIGVGWRYIVSLIKKLFKKDVNKDE